MSLVDLATLSAPAKDAYELFEAVFYHLDTRFSQCHPGLITIDKLMGQCKALGMDSGVEEYETIKATPQILSIIYEALGVENYLVPAETTKQYESFTAPLYPAATKQGFIKYLIVTVLIELDDGKSETYDHLVKAHSKLGFTYPGSTTPLQALPPKHIFDMNVTLLGGSLRVPVGSIRKAFQSIKDGTYKSATITTSLSAPPPPPPAPPAPPLPPRRSNVDRKYELAQRELREAQDFEEAQAEMNRNAREIALLNQATRLSQAQMVRSMQSMDLLGSI